MEEKFKELEDEIHLDIEDKEDENSSDKKNHLKSVLKRIRERPSLRANKVHEMDKEYQRENQ